MTSPTLVPDFDRQGAMIFTAGRLGTVFPQVLVDVLAELLGHLPVVLLVQAEEQRSEILAALTDWGLPAHLIYFVGSDAKLMWARDYGPQFLRDGRGNLTAVDAHYFREGGAAEDEVPADLATLLRLPLIRCPLTVEGGNILTNGAGLCLTTTTFIERNIALGLSVDQLGREFKQTYAFSGVVALEPLASEPTGHVDMFAAFTSADTVVVGQYDPAIDPVNAEILDRNAALLSRLDFAGRPLRVERIPMPTNHGAIWRTFTNVLFANGTLLIPGFQDVDPSLSQTARDTYRRLLPEWSIRSIRADNLIHGRGALRCLSCPIPFSPTLLGVLSPGEIEEPVA